MKIVVASGKGGTGKSTVSANLGSCLSANREVILADCDVEEPNLHIFFSEASDASDRTCGQDVTVPVPSFDPERCNLCGKCANFCRYGAITVLKDRVILFEKLCHSCGGCRIICPNDAVTEVPRAVGRVIEDDINSNLKLITGVLNEGEAVGIPVIKKVKATAEDAELVILDSAPGSACPAIETIEGADYCILVTESTPFGLHDMALVAEVVRQAGIPAGVVINRSDDRDEETEAFCHEHNLPIIMKIPFSKKIAAVQNRGDLFSSVMPEWQNRFIELFNLISSTVKKERVI